MYGWRARIGIIYAVGYTDHEFYQMAPEGVSVHITRATTPGKSAFELPPEFSGASAFIDEIGRRARDLSKMRPQALVWMSTSGSFLDPAGGDGLDWDQALKDRMVEASGGIASTTTSSSAVLALRAVGARRVAVASPYKPEAERALRTYLEKHGFEVVAMRGIGCEDVWEIGNLGPEVAYRVARDADRPEADAVFIAETSFRTVEVIQPLEADLGKPVISANAASMWNALRLAGVRAKQPRFGQLFERGDA
jgi:maleate cis-trans isomerase